MFIYFIVQLVLWILLMSKILTGPINFSAKKSIPKDVDLKYMSNKFHYNCKDIALFDILCTLFKQAKKRVYISTLLISLNDKNGNVSIMLDILNSLKIDVIISYDNFTTYVVNNNCNFQQLYPNIKFIPIGQLTPLGNLSTHHRKIFIVDDYVLYTGGNFDNDYMIVDSYYVESYFLVHNNVVADNEVVNYFSATDASISPIRNKLYNNCKNNEFWINEISTKNVYNKTAISILQESLNKAKDKIIFTSNIFLPNLEILEMFENTLKRGIDVTIITNNIGYSSKGIPCYYIGHLSKYKNFHSYVSDTNKNSFHTKLIIIDDTEVVYTTFNLSEKSLLWDMENWIVIDPSIELLKSFMNYVEFLKQHSTPYDSGTYPNCILYVISYLFKYMI
jgi:phosphatidylserine/phosphatidylglycerophosphate/cardiolipin synthase-like enzyme